MSDTPLTDKATYTVNGERVVGAGLATILEIAFNTAQAECDSFRARAEKSEAECVEWRRLLQMSRDDREQDLISREVALIARAEKAEARMIGTKIGTT